MNPELRRMCSMATDLRDPKPLPPLAGAGAILPLLIPTERIERAVWNQREGSTLTYERSLLSQISPTVMEEWNLASLWLPVAWWLQFAPTAANIEASLTAELTYGGDLIWGTQQRTLMVLPLGEHSERSANFTVAESFNNIAPIRRGRDLRLRVTASFNFNPTPAEASLTTALAALLLIGSSIRAGEHGLPLTGTAQQASLTYDANVLTGHRTL